MKPEEHSGPDVALDRRFCVAVGPRGMGIAGALAVAPAGGAPEFEEYQGPALRIRARSFSGSAKRIRTVGGVTYCLEGVIYSSGRERLERFLADVLQESDFTAAAAKVQAFAAGEDGEFVVAAEQAGTGRCLVFNDYLGRLPLFMARAEGGAWIVIGRSLAAVRALRGGPSAPDRMGIAARLLLGYPLDARTEFEGIEGFPESGLIWLGAAGQSPQLAAGKVFYGGEASASGGGRSSGPAELEELGEGLIRACRQRIERLRGWTPTLALSGGFDSRLVAAALARTGAVVEAFTRTDHLSIAEDAEVAGRIAGLLGFRHHAFACGEVDAGTIRALAELGEGGIGGELAHMLGFLQVARDRLGPARFMLTGDGGDKTVAPLLSLGRLTEGGAVRRLQAHLFRESYEACRAITGVSEREIREYVEQSFRRQPGSSPAAKYRACLFRQRARRWLSLGEDRNRSVYWSTTPFYAPEFFVRANAIADAAKQRDRLYLRLLEWFDGRLARIPRPGQGRRPLAEWLRREAQLQLGRSAALSKACRRLRPKRNPPPLREIVADCVRQAAEKGGGIWELCDAQVLRRHLADPPAPVFRSHLLSLALANLGTNP